MKTKTCPDCHGDGVIDKDTDDERQCPTCGGLGFVSDDTDGNEEVIKTATGFAVNLTLSCRADAVLENVVFVPELDTGAPLVVLNRSPKQGPACVGGTQTGPIDFIP